VRSPTEVADDSENDVDKDAWPNVSLKKVILNLTVLASVQAGVMNGAVTLLQARTVVVEKDVAHQRQTAQETAQSLETLANEVKNMKVRIDELHDNRPAPEPARGSDGAPDPWADFLNRKKFDKALQQHGISTISPDPTFQNCPTHYPRDEERSGRQIDMAFKRQLHIAPLTFATDRRLAIGSDHALIFADIFVANGPCRTRWRNDSRARWVNGQLGDDVIVDEEDLIAIAKNSTKPRASAKYKDSDEVIAAIRTARSSNLASDWKRAHRLRRRHRKDWQQQRLSAILGGDWDQYRCLQNEKKRIRGWWGSLLADKSAEQLAAEIHDHLAEKMTSMEGHSKWDAELDDVIQSLGVSLPFTPFQLHEVCAELQGMKARSAVGPDQVGVHLLRAIVAHDTLADGLLGLINHIVARQELPASWEHSFLALLAKIPQPQRPADLRPICVSDWFALASFRRFA
ncbi:pol, partial [Symbiodinium sp. CCMP2456]